MSRDPAHAVDALLAELCASTGVDHPDMRLCQIVVANVNSEQHSQYFNMSTGEHVPDMSARGYSTEDDVVMRYLRRRNAPGAM